MLWNTFMLPTEDMEMYSITPATILTLLAADNESYFTVPITRQLIDNRCICLQANGGVNRLVTNNRDMIHVSWDIADYSIGP